MDDSTLGVYTILFVMITVLLVYTSRYFLARRSRRLSQGRAPGFERLSGWLGESIEAGRPLHLSFGSAGIDRENAAVAAAEAELFYHIIKAARSGDVAPVISTSSSATLPLCQDTIRRAWGRRRPPGARPVVPGGRALAGFCRGSDSDHASRGPPPPISWLAALVRNWR